MFFLPYTDLVLVKGVEVDKRGDIIANEFQDTTAKNIYAVGDVIGKWQLTPGKKIS